MTIFNHFSLARLLLVSLIVTFASGCTYRVDSFLDQPDINPGDFLCETADGTCTLRAAVMEASASATPDTILLPEGIYTLNLSTRSGGGSLQVANNMTIQGAGRDSTIVNQTTADRVIDITAGNVEINNLTVQGGNTQNGGGIQIDNASVDIHDVMIQDNFAFTGGGGLYVRSGGDARVRRLWIRDNIATGAFGGGIRNQGTLWVYESAVIDNQANRAGGIHNAGNLNLRNVTVSGNSAVSDAAGTGGMVNIQFAVLNNVTMTNNTGVGNNSASFRGGGILTTDDATTVVKNSIIAGNDGGSGPDDCVGPLTGDSKYNLIGSTEACTIPSFVFTFILDQAAELGPLLLNGGSTPTHVPVSTSPARNSAYQFPPPAADACETHDQRGVPRPQSTVCDMGAVEYTSVSYNTTGLVLVNAETFTDIQAILHGDTLDLSTLPPQLSIRAEISGIPTSLVFAFDDNPLFQVEHNSPYALGGDNGSTYNPVELTEGEHSVRATPFDQADGQGNAGFSYGISFNVIQ